MNLDRSPITRSLRLLYKPSESTIFDEKLFIERGEERFREEGETAKKDREGEKGSKKNKEMGELA